MRKKRPDFCKNCFISNKLVALTARPIKETKPRKGAISSLKARNFGKENMKMCGKIFMKNSNLSHTKGQNLGSITAAPNLTKSKLFQSPVNFGRILKEKSYMSKSKKNYMDRSRDIISKCPFGGKNETSLNQELEAAKIPHSELYTTKDEEKRITCLMFEKRNSALFRQAQNILSTETTSSQFKHFSSNSKTNLTMPNIKKQDLLMNHKMTVPSSTISGQTSGECQINLQRNAHNSSMIDYKASSNLMHFKPSPSTTNTKLNETTTINLNNMRNAQNYPILALSKQKDTTLASTNALVNKSKNIQYFQYMANTNSMSNRNGEVRSASVCVPNKKIVSCYVDSAGISISPMKKASKERIDLLTEKNANKKAFEELKKSRIERMPEYKKKEERESEFQKALKNQDYFDSNNTYNFKHLLRKSLHDKIFNSSSNTPAKISPRSTNISPTTTTTVSQHPSKLTHLFSFIQNIDKASALKQSSSDLSKEATAAIHIPSSLHQHKHYKTYKDQKDNKDSSPTLSLLGSNNLSPPLPYHHQDQYQDLENKLQSQYSSIAGSRTSGINANCGRDFGETRRNILFSNVLIKGKVQRQRERELCRKNLREQTSGIASMEGLNDGECVGGKCVDGEERAVVGPRERGKNNMSLIGKEGCEEGSGESSFGVLRGKEKEEAFEEYGCNFGMRERGRKLSSGGWERNLNSNANKLLDIDMVEFPSEGGEKGLEAVYTSDVESACPSKEYSPIRKWNLRSKNYQKNH
jgi:hypothetical protein